MAGRVHGVEAEEDDRGDNVHFLVDQGHHDQVDGSQEVEAQGHQGLAHVELHAALGVGDYRAEDEAHAEEGGAVEGAEGDEHC